MSTHSLQNEMTLKGNEIEYAKRKKKHFKAALLFLRSQLVYFLLV